MVEMHIETAMPLQCHSLELSAMSTATFCCRGDATYFRYRLWRVSSLSVSVRIGLPLCSTYGTCTVPYVNLSMKQSHLHALPSLPSDGQFEGQWMLWRTSGGSERFPQCSWSWCIVVMQACSVLTILTWLCLMANSIWESLMRQTRSNEDLSDWVQKCILASRRWTASKLVTLSHSLPKNGTVLNCWVEQLLAQCVDLNFAL